MSSVIIAGDTSGTITLTAPAVAGSGVLTLPVATDTLVGKATTDTLTNKTLTGAVINGTVGATTPAAGAFTTLSASGVLGVSHTSTGSTAAYFYNLSATGFGVLTRGGGGTTEYIAQWLRYDGSERMTLTNTGLAVTGTLSATTGAAVGGATAGAGGLAFPATAVAVADANTLDDYEEGTWTPNANFGWADVGTVTRTGTYTKIGRQVFITVKIAASGGGNVSMTNANITNLPFTTANAAVGGWGVVSNYGSATETQNVLVDGAVMFFTGSWVGVANYIYTASATYTV